MRDDPRIHVSLEHLRNLQGAAEQLSFLPRQPARSVLNGQHASRLRGRGLNFEEMRDYLPGDDVRSIDWKATARTGSPHVRVYTEERDRPALLVVDQRMSMFFGSTLNMKSVTAVEAAAIAAFGVLGAGDRVGGIVFDDSTQAEFAPRRSRRTVFALLQAMTRFNGALHAAKRVDESADRLNDVLRPVARLARHDHLVVILSDFAGANETTRKRLATIAAHNDVLLMLVHDPLAEQGLTQGEPIVLGDGQLQAEIDLGHSATLEAVGGFTRQRLQTIRNWQREINLSVLPLNAAHSTLPQIRQLLDQRRPARSRA
ncbi:DUF58 domain-containing protein [Haliea salexigens]|nr:DUF58 domain-containing protein [Haliea salexigens]|tara:strand:- start:6632 stop:7576 length:945 start_codon:yes stop_codon:yes gene_type:complete